MPLVRTPLQASANQLQSQSCWAPYLAAEKLASFARPDPSLATHPIMGMVIIGRREPLWSVKAMKLSASAPWAVPP